MSRELAGPDDERLLAENAQLAESLRQAEDLQTYYVDLFDSAPLAYLVLDANGFIREVNRAATVLLGADHGHQLVGRHLRAFLADRHRGVVVRHLRRCMVSNRTLACETYLRDGTPVQIWSRRASNTRRVMPTVIVDMRDRARADAERRRLVESESSARAASMAKDNFIATLSHELRTPLTPILAAANALHARGDLPPSMRAMCDMIERNVRTEARLIDDLLDVTRIARGKMSVDRRPVDVHEVMREAIETVRADVEARGLKLEVALDARHHCASADPVRLNQVFWNLLRNAIKFTGGDGTIVVRSWNIDDGLAGPRLSRDRRIAVEVSDTGIGFDPAATNRLFEPFEQGSNAPDRLGGLGLGLAICKGVVELHGGHIAANSLGVNRGARFVVDLQTIDDAVPIPAAEDVVVSPPLPTSQPGHKQRILLVDDHADTASMLGELLVDAGYDVQTAGSVKAALAVDLDHVDLMVSDIGLPDATGHDLMRAIRSAPRALKGIALSGYGTEADIQASIDAGFSVHLTKPIDVNRLLATIRSVALR